MPFPPLPAPPPRRASVSRPQAHSRRAFLRDAALTCGCAALAAPLAGLAAAAPAGSTAPAGGQPAPHALERELEALLRTWCDGLLRHQIDAPADTARHGAYRCPACGDTLHGRAADSAYPLLCLAHRTGEARYADAARRALEWMSRNVESPDGAWLNDPIPKAWKGITVFTSIALAEALHHHGALFAASECERWRTRLRRAGDFLLANFKVGYGNINYPVSATHALALLGHLLDEPRFTSRARSLAREVLACLTPGGLLYGEGKPLDRITAKSCRPIDLAYNLEESLPSLAAYARLEKDREVEERVVAALAAHLEFMLPDGALDEGWCSRAAKWTYYGSRTSDGCCTGLLALSDRHPAFAAAAFRNLRLMRACTHGGLLHGGPHYHLHGAPPCVHHTFTHAKAVAAVLDSPPAWTRLSPDAPLPREAARGVRVFPEADAHLAALGPWRATIVGYDYVHGDVVHSTGGAPSVVHHAALGTLCAASLAHYSVPEPLNMQPPTPDGNHPLTPRIELRRGNAWLTNLYDLEARIASESSTSRIRFTVDTRVRAVPTPEVPAKPGATPPAGSSPQIPGPTPGQAGPGFRLGYEFTAEAFSFTAKAAGDCSEAWSLVLPVASPAGEVCRRLSDRRFAIEKPNGGLIVEADAPLEVLPSARDRVFNLVPGLEAIPFAVHASGAVSVSIRIQPGRA